MPVHTTRRHVRFQNLRFRFFINLHFRFQNLRFRFFINLHFRFQNLRFRFFISLYFRFRRKQPFHQARFFLRFQQRFRQTRICRCLLAFQLTELREQRTKHVILVRLLCLFVLLRLEPLLHFLLFFDHRLRLLGCLLQRIQRILLLLLRHLHAQALQQLFHAGTAAALGRSRFLHNLIHIIEAAAGNIMQFLF